MEKLDINEVTEKVTEKITTKVAKEIATLVVRQLREIGEVSADNISASIDIKGVKISIDSDDVRSI